VGYGFDMTTDTQEFVASKVRAARVAGEAARRNRARMAQIRALGSAAAIVFAGLLLAVLFCLVTHRILV